MKPLTTVALFTDGLFPDVIGGMQKHSFFLAEYLARNGVKVDLYYTAPDENHRQALDAFSEIARRNIHPVFVSFPSMGKLPGHYIKESYAYSERLFKEWQLRPESDIIYAQGFTGWHVCKMRISGKLQVPVLANLHGLEMFQPAFGLKAKSIKYMLQSPADYILKHADVVYSLGGRLTGILQNRIPESKILVQRIGIDAAWVIPKSELKPVLEKPRKFIFVGRYEKRKGLDILNKVMAESDPEWCTFHLAGPIGIKEQVNKSNVHYHGLIKAEDEMRRLLDSCDVLLCPSFAEGMPTVIIEAMARGLAVIASDVGAVSELVSDSTGWLIEPGNQKDLQLAISEAVSGKAIVEKQQAARELILHKFTWDTVVADTIDGVVKVLKNNKMA
jgi:glycosyltransferase involved in cell wall biosynthesis